MTEQRLSREWLSVGAATLARQLLGCVLVRTLDNGTRLAGRIVETEAYLGVRDQGCHSFKGRRTPRVEPMYGPGGTAYVYFTYGMHCCMNVVCGAIDEPVAVLLRGLEPIEGIDTMRNNRAAASRRTKVRDEALCRGPGNLCRAMAIGLELTGADLTRDPQLSLEFGELTPAEVRQIRRSARIGLGSAGPWTDRPLRWVVQGSTGATVAPKPRA